MHRYISSWSLLSPSPVLVYADFFWAISRTHTHTHTQNTHTRTTFWAKIFVCIVCPSGPSPAPRGSDEWLTVGVNTSTLLIWCWCVQETSAHCGRHSARRTLPPAWPVGVCVCVCVYDCVCVCVRVEGGMMVVQAVFGVALWWLELWQALPSPTTMTHCILCRGSIYR